MGSYVPVVFWWPGRTQNHKPKHFLKLQGAQARGVERPEIIRVRQAYGLKASGIHFECLGLGFCALVVLIVITAQGRKGNVSSYLRQKPGHPKNMSL